MSTSAVVSRAQVLSSDNLTASSADAERGGAAITRDFLQGRHQLSSSRHDAENLKDTPVALLGINWPPAIGALIQ
jgi:hypothetical protein